MLTRRAKAYSSSGSR